MLQYIGPPLRCYVPSKVGLIYQQHPSWEGYNYYVVCKPWIWTIHGLLCSKHGSALERTIHGLLAQFVDRAKQNVQSMDSDNPVIVTHAIQQAFWASRSSVLTQNHPVASYCKVRLLFLRKKSWKNKLNSSIYSIILMLWQRQCSWCEDST